VNIALQRDGAKLPQLCFVGDNGVGKTALLLYMSKKIQEGNGWPGYLEINDFARALQETKGEAMNELGYMYNSNILLVDTLEALKGRVGTQKVVLKLIEYSTSRNIPFVCSFAGDVPSLNKYCQDLTKTKRDLANRIGGFEKIILEAPPMGGRQKFIRDLMRKQDNIRRVKDPDTLAEHLNLMIPMGLSIRRMEGDLKTAINYVGQHNDFTPGDLFNLLGHDKGILMDPKTIINTIAQNNPISREELFNGSEREEVRYYQQYVAFALKELGYLKPAQIAITMNTSTQKVAALLKGFHQDVREPVKRENILGELTTQILAPHSL
jgi:chromosomal replication initiation ATPase DnaA